MIPSGGSSRILKAKKHPLLRTMAAGTFCLATCSTPAVAQDADAERFLQERADFYKVKVKELSDSTPLLGSQRRSNAESAEIVASALEQNQWMLRVIREFERVSGERLPLSTFPDELRTRIKDRDEAMLNADLFRSSRESAHQKAVTLTRVITTEAKAIFAELRAKGEEKRRASSSAAPVGSGSGFFVSSEGHVLTNQHVIAGCKEIWIRGAQMKLLASDPRNDLALLKSPEKPVRVAPFRNGRGIRPGDPVVVIGFPLAELLKSTEPNVTTGSVSSLTGIGDDSSVFRMTAPVQPGNSGGPVLDSAGNVVGVTVARLAEDAAQNVNFAVSEGTVRAFLDSQSVPFETASSVARLEPADVVAKAGGWVLPIRCVGQSQ